MSIIKVGVQALAFSVASFDCNGSSFSAFVSSIRQASILANSPCVVSPLRAIASSVWAAGSSDYFVTGYEPSTLAIASLLQSHRVLIFRLVMSLSMAVDPSVRQVRSSRCFVFDELLPSIRQRTFWCLQFCKFLLLHFCNSNLPMLNQVDFHSRGRARSISNLIF
jgi:hypothetical protein